MTENRVFILGAGASIGHTAGAFPSINTIFKKAVELNILNEARLQLNEKYSRLSKYTEATFDKNVLTTDELNFEEVLTSIDIDLENNQDPEIIAVRAEALDLIRHTLMDSSEGTGDSVREYDLLLEMLSTDDSVVTFNWDILLDEKMGRSWLVDESPFRDPNRKKTFSGNQYDNFLLHLSGRSNATWDHVVVSPPYTRYSSALGYYLKLHGSVDWYYCDGASCRARFLIFPVTDFFNDNYCSECHRRMKPLLIPPTLNKSYYQYPSIQTLWTTALREVERCAEIVIWGYSLPPTDFYSAWLLRNRTKARKISLIDPACVNKPRLTTRGSPPKWNRLFLNRYAGLFSSNLRLNAKIFPYENFPDYKESLTISQKYQIKEPF
jgi:hypothetical protein